MDRSGCDPVVGLCELGVEPLVSWEAWNFLISRETVEFSRRTLFCGLSHHRRTLSSIRTQQPGSLPDYQVDPYRLLEDDLKDVYDDIREELQRNTTEPELKTIATYYFDGQGKALRPMVAILMARAINYHMYKEKSGLLASQRQVAMISEMIHSASLVHDDVVDQADFRRGKPSVNVLWNHKKLEQLNSVGINDLILQDLYSYVERNPRLVNMQDAQYMATDRITLEEETESLRISRLFRLTRLLKEH
ncbi:hypothetical protein B7P43_G01143 [Cryptotermes secundus]|uniref:Decaprenyl-diphosphate synthase subunit 1 n=1 Tax=Cryptotermes secundus TaxID=105785 RepID=A0A2J7QZS3_9NEOP|nr:hypothetical protein B7P43_G01143 [Cryptotermes secundus]